MAPLTDVVVVGGGIAGATAAASAAGAGARVVLVTGRTPAGRAATDERSGFLLNRGAHGLYDQGAGRVVLERLGVPIRGAPSPLEGALGRRRDTVDRLPLGSGVETTRLLSGRDTVQLGRVLSDLPRWKLDDLAGRSIASWVGDLDLSDGAREMFEMLVRWSAYCADHQSISADVAVTQLRIASRGITYVDGGWKTLVADLIDVAQRSGAVVVPSTVSHVEPLAGGGAEVHIDDQRVRAPAVVLAAGSPTACSALLPDAPGGWSALGPKISAACLDLGLDHVPPTSVLLGVDEPLYLIRHAPPAQLAPPAHAVVHVMKYLTPDDTATSRETRRELEHHAAVAGIEPRSAIVGRYLHDMPVVTAAAAPGCGGLRGRATITSSGHRGVLVAGDWVGPTGHLADTSFASGHDAGIHAARRVAIAN